MKSENITHILLLEDNPGDRDLIQEMLEETGESSSYSVTSFMRLKEALAYLNENKNIDIILSDVKLPDAEGQETAVSLRKAAFNIPIVLITNSVDDTQAVKAIQEGVQDYLEKGKFDGNTLIRSIRYAIERKKIEEKLKNAEKEIYSAEQNLERLFTEAPALIGLLQGLNGEITLFNPLFHKIWGKRPVLHKTMREAFPELEGQGFYEIIEKVYRTGESVFENEKSLLIKENNSENMNELFFNFVYQATHNSSGEINGVAIYGVNVTDTVIARRIAEESEEKFRFMAESIPQKIFTAAPNGSLDYFNPQWLEFSGLTYDQFLNKGWLQLVPEEKYDENLKAMRDSIQTEGMFQLVHQLRRFDGIYKWHITRALPMKDEKGKVIKWFGSSTDIDEQKRSMERKDEFIGIASHELRTPVTSVKAYTQILERRFLKKGELESADLLKKMNVQLNKLTKLINDLLDVTKIENGKIKFTYEEFDFEDLVSEIIEETQRTTTNHTISKKLNSQCTVNADRERIGQVITNLISNAIKYSSHSSIINVSTDFNNGEVILNVQDFGVGIPKDEQDKVFERFFRASGQETFPGLGLGLYISSQIIKRHNGKIWLVSTEGKGSTFSFSIPIK